MADLLSTTQALGISNSAALNVADNETSMNAIATV